MGDGPYVRVEPAVRFGYPHINGVATDAIAGMVWAGETVATVADEYGITRAEVLVACWFEARHGRPRTGYRAAWRAWARRAGQVMWHGGTSHELVKDPPSKEEVSRGGA